MAQPEQGQPEAQESRESRERSSGKSWTEEEKEFVRRHIAEFQEAGLTLTESFKKIAQKMPHRSEAAIAMLYYNVLRKEQKPRVVRMRQRPLEITDDLVQAFEGLPEYMSRLNQRIEALESERKAGPGFEPEVAARQLAALAKTLQEAATYQERLQRKEQELAQAQQRIAELESQLTAFRRRFEDMDQAYRDARELYDLFTNMASISQIMSLGDFKQRMRTTLDRWGSVLKVDFERQESVSSQAASL